MKKAWIIFGIVFVITALTIGTITILEKIFGYDFFINNILFIPGILGLVASPLLLLVAFVKTFSEWDNIKPKNRKRLLWITFGAWCTLFFGLAIGIEGPCSFRSINSFFESVGNCVFDFIEGDETGPLGIILCIPMVVSFVFAIKKIGVSDYYSSSRKNTYDSFYDTSSNKKTSPQEDAMLISMLVRQGESCKTCKNCYNSNCPYTVKPKVAGIEICRKHSS